jgi:hypothetical protein
MLLAAAMSRQLEHAVASGAACGRVSCFCWGEMLRHDSIQGHTALRYTLWVPTQGHCGHCGQRDKGPSSTKSSACLPHVDRVYQLFAPFAEDCSLETLGQQ